MCIHWTRVLYYCNNMTV